MEWLAENWQLSKEFFLAGKYFLALATQLGIAITVVLFIFGMIYERHRKRVFLVLFALWGYSATYHFTIEKTIAETANSNLVQNIGGVGSMAQFFLGAIIVTGILLYYIFVHE